MVLDGGGGVKTSSFTCTSVQKRKNCIEVDEKITKYNLEAQKTRLAIVLFLSSLEVRNVDAFLVDNNNL